MAIPPILCVSGPSPNGKTTLLEGLVRVLSAGGLKVGAVRQSPQGPVAIGPDGLAVEAGADVSLLDLATDFCGGCDIVLAEGHERSPFDRMSIEHCDDLRAAAGRVRQWLARRVALRRGVMGAILVGGRSRRMGADKALMRVGDRRVLPRLAELLGGRLEDVRVIGQPSEGLGLPRCVGWHGDRRQGRGPLGGIAAALIAAGGPTPAAVLAVACDMPSLDGEVLDLLLERRRRDRPASALRNEATGQLEPLAAIYEPQALPAIEQALDAGAYSATELLRAIGALEIPVGPELARRLANVNTPEELERIEGIGRGEQE